MRGCFSSSLQLVFCGSQPRWNVPPGICTNSSPLFGFRMARTRGRAAPQEAALDEELRCLGGELLAQPADGLALEELRGEDVAALGVNEPDRRGEVRSWAGMACSFTSPLPMKQPTQATRARCPEVPWRLVAGLRDRVVHAYAEVDLELLWDAATTHVPPLLARLEQILDQEAGG